MSDLRRTGRRRFLALAGASASALLAACSGAASPTAAPAAKPADTKPADTKPTSAEPTKPAAAGAATPAAPAPTAAAGASPAAAAPAAASTGKSIKYQQRDSTTEDFVRKKYGPEFEQKTGTKVVFEDIPANEYFTKVTALSAAKQLGDLVFGYNSSGYNATWAFKGILAPHDPYIQQDKYDLKQFYDACIDGCRFEGKLYSMPPVGHPGEINIYWNKDLFQAAGAKPLDDSLTLDSVVEAAKATTKESAGSTQWGYASDMSGWFQIIQRVRLFGGDELSEDGKKSLMNSDAAKAALQWEHDMRYKHKVAPTPDKVQDNVGNMFTAGKVAMNTNNVANISVYKKPIGDKFKWAPQAWPTGQGGYHGATIHVNTTGLTTQAKEPGLAWEFLKSILTQEVGVQKVLMGSGSPGARPDVWQDKRLTELDPWYAKANDILKVAKAPNMAYNLRTAEVDNVMSQRVSEIMLNKATPAEGAEKMAKEMQAILDQPR
jgi:ABC-type glycerol-3-phosphate transport system substrate-binding protein